MQRTPSEVYRDSNCAKFLHALERDDTQVLKDLWILAAQDRFLEEAFLSISEDYYRDCMSTRVAFSPN